MSRPDQTWIDNATDESESQATEGRGKSRKLEKRILERRNNKEKQPKLKSKSHRLLAIGAIGQTWPTLVRFQEQSKFSLYFVCF